MIPMTDATKQGFWAMGLGAAVAWAGSACANQLNNPSFEDGLNNWVTFNNIFPTSDNAFTGNMSALALGPFFNLPNASGFFQDVAVTAGDALEAGIWALNDTTILNGQGNPDVITGTGNFVELLLEYRTAPGAANPFQVDRVTIADGMDSGIIEDQWYRTTLASLVPAGATTARFVVLFNQPTGFPGGLVFLDDATLVPEPASAALLAGLGSLALRRRR